MIYCVSSEPNDESAANVDAAKNWRDDRKGFEEIAHVTVRKSLGLWPGLSKLTVKILDMKFLL